MGTLQVNGNVIANGTMTIKTGTYPSFYLQSENGTNIGFLEGSSQSQGKIAIWAQDSITNMNNRRGFEIKNASVATLDSALIIDDLVDGKSTKYKIYGEHNKPTPAAIGAAAASHTHSYLPLNGGTVTGSINITADFPFYFNTGADAKSTYLAANATGLYLAVNGSSNAGRIIYLETYNTDIIHRKNGVDSTMLTSSNYSSWCASKSHTHSLLYSSAFGNLEWGGEDHMLSSSARPTAKLHFGATQLYQHRADGYHILLDDGNWSTWCAAKSHTHSYLPLSGGTMTDTLTSSSVMPFMFYGAGSSTYTCACMYVNTTGGMVFETPRAGNDISYAPLPFRVVSRGGWEGGYYAPLYCQKVVVQNYGSSLPSSGVYGEIFYQT